MMTRIRYAGGLAAAIAVFAGCESPAGPEGMARLQVLLTDAPSDMIASAEVAISRVYLQRGDETEVDGEAQAEGDESAGRVDLFNDPENPQTYDLLLLQDGVTAALTEEVEIPAGDYAQLRLVVQSATITLAEGYEFSDGTMEKELFIPSGAQSGIKVQLTSAVDAEAGTTTIVLVDFDVNDNFVIQGDPDSPGGIENILFTPLLREKSRDVEEGGS